MVLTEALTEGEAGRGGKAEVLCPWAVHSYMVGQLKFAEAAAQVQAAALITETRPSVRPCLLRFPGSIPKLGG